MLLDTYAWIEYFKATEKGEKVKKLIENSNCFTSAISLAEISYFAQIQNLDKDEALTTVKQLSTIIDLEHQALESAGAIKAEKRKTVKDIGLIDSIIIAVSRTYQLPIVTGDSHFKGENLILI